MPRDKNKVPRTKRKRKKIMKKAKRPGFKSHRR